MARPDHAGHRSAGDPVDVIACAELGFSAFLPREASIQAAHDAILAAARDEMDLFWPSGKHLNARDLRASRPAVLEGMETCLTARERQIVALLAKDRSNKEIARALSISGATVKNHVHNILTKLGAVHRRAAVARVQANPALLRRPHPL